MVNEFDTWRTGTDSVLDLHSIDLRFDLVHHPHEADGVGSHFADILSLPSLLPDPGKPDGAAGRLKENFTSHASGMCGTMSKRAGDALQSGRLTNEKTFSPM